MVSRLGRRSEMRSLVFCAAVAVFWSTSAFAQQRPSTSAAPAPLDACKVIEEPEKYAGQIVELRGLIYYNFEELSMGGADCKDVPYLLRIWLAFLDELEAREDPTLQGQHLTLTRDKASAQLERYILEKNPKCEQPRVVATLRGYLQHKNELATFYPNGNIASIVGYGHMGMYSRRLVILSVVHVEKLPCPG